jgi:hypothetical protein
MEKTGTLEEAVALWKPVVINGPTDAAISCWTYPESNPDYVL